MALDRVAADPKPERASITCVVCGRSILVRPSELRRKYCSRSCYRQKPTKWTAQGRASVIAKNRDRQGAKNPNYRGGHRVGDKMLNAYFTVHTKGEHSCRNCGRTEGKIDAHHAIPRSIGTRQSRLDLRNLLPLCCSCHRRWHAGTPIPRSVFHSDEWAYIASLALTGRITAAYLDKHYPGDAA